MPSLITLTTDLGEREPFAAMIKGVLLSQCPGVQVLDLSHEIAPHSVMEGAIFAMASFPCFPEGTVHLLNVAPGPRAIAARFDGQFVVCPDNGLLTLLGLFQEIEEVREITMAESVRKQTHQIRYGREVFAPAAAQLAGGGDFGNLGPLLEDWHRLDVPVPVRSGSKLVEGRIMHVDRFGNLITNIHRRHLEGDSVDRIASGNFCAYELAECYADVDDKKPIALFGHSGYLELAYNGDHAGDRTNLSPGILVSVVLS